MSGASTWRVEWWRLVRTRRLLVLAFLYLFLGCAGPLVAKYAQQLFSGVSGSRTVTITVARARPADGVLGFYKSAMQLGLIACIVIAGLAFCVDGRPALSTYYRTRSSMVRVLVPRLVMAAAAAAAAFTLGFLFAVYETVALIGAPALGDTAQTWALGVTYTVFAVVLTFIVSAVLRGTLAVVGTAIGVVILLPIVGNITALSRWVPSRLTSLPTDLFQGASDTSPLAALAVCGLVAALGVLVGLRLLEGRTP